MLEIKTNNMRIKYANFKGVCPFCGHLMDMTSRQMRPIHSMLVISSGHLCCEKTNVDIYTFECALCGTVLIGPTKPIGTEAW